MGHLTAILAALIAAIALQQSFVHATLQDTCTFSWGRGVFTGPDSLELRMDQYGGSGIISTASYLYGAITMRIKLVPGYSAGTVTTFYLYSPADNHDEVDFEFLGNGTGEPYTVHTNIFTQGFGQREQQFRLWFDPTDGYHTYTIFWNPFAVVWIVDKVPIRVFRNYNDPEINFPDSQPMNMHASLWNADDWATQGGRLKTNWTLAPFVAGFQKYEPYACICPDKTGVAKCSNKEPANWWTDPKYSKLSSADFGKLKWARANHMIYDYCTDTKRFNGQFPKECSLPQY